jgi:hypothetical protein
MLPIIDADIPAPIIVPVESDADPPQVPDTAVALVDPTGVEGVEGLESIIELLPHATVARVVAKTKPSNGRRWWLLRLPGAGGCLLQRFTNRPVGDRS